MLLGGRDGAFSPVLGGGRGCWTGVQICDGGVATVIGDFYQREAFLYEIIAKLGRMGLFGLPFDERYGGTGGGYFALCLAVEELARVDSSVAVTSTPLSRSVRCRSTVSAPRSRSSGGLPRLAAGEMIGAFGMTEPGAGSDVGAARTTAVLEGDEWVISGVKAYVTNGATEVTGLIVVTAVTEGSLSMIVVPSSSRSPTWRRGHTPRDRPIYAAAARMLRGEPFKREVAIAKLVSANAAMDNARDATQIFGGSGFINETPVARFYRDAKILEIGEGTSEVQRMLVARELGL
jgi:alkylation response protein AidB-like acyl-CoA dehydrogenase